uniref:DNA-directed RNA polymerase subunit n=1 Tax=Pithovirus LCPAC101 TaxID=2506586 RepID=A0A481Z4W0_9VIRU|nr:MAG: DNA-directed RNA polymerase subunit alpha [Pithovirus LCPAC101]
MSTLPKRPTRPTAGATKRINFSRNRKTRNIGQIPSQNVPNTPSLTGNNNSNPLDGIPSQFVGKFTNMPEANTINESGVSNTIANDSSYSTYFDASEEFEGSISISDIRKMRDQLPLYEVERIQFGVLSEKMKSLIAVARVENSNSSGSGSINDPRFGVVPGNSVCSTCNLSLDTCPGHFGFIDISKYPIYHPLFIKDIVDVLSSVCASCGKLLITEDNIIRNKYNYIEGHSRIKEIAEYIKKHKPCCRGRFDIEKGTKKPFISSIGGIKEAETIACEINPIYKTGAEDEKKGVIRIDTHRKSTIKEKDILKEKKKIDSSVKVSQKVHLSNNLHPNEAFKILNMITDEDAQLLGFSEGTHPRDLITKSILTIPPAYRGASLVSPGAFTVDKLGPVYLDMLKKIYQAPPKSKNGRRTGVMTPEEIRVFLYTKYSDLLFYKVKDGTSGMRAYKGIFTKINGKEGILRQLALGKRVDYTGRTVIGPNPFLTVEEVGVPRIWRSFLTVPRVARAYNVKALIELLRVGHVSSILHGGGLKKGRITRIDDHNKDTVFVHFGDTLHCWLRDGDYITLNRQPSLHKQNLMGHKVKLVESLNLQLNPIYTSPYNADFDGDEMNVHAPQTVEARAEVEMLMSLKNCFMNEQSNSPMIGLIMSDITGVYLLTSQFHDIDMATWFSCDQLIQDRDQLLTIDQRLAIHGISNFSGNALFSKLLPADFNYTKNNVSIRNGVLIKGEVTKGIISASGGSIVQVLRNDYGNDRTGRFLTDSSRVINRWFSTYGFSIGLESCSHTNPEISDLKEEQMALIRLLVQKMGDKLEDPDEESKRQEEVVTSLSGATNKALNMMEKTFGKYNRLAQMILSGSKGSTFNSSQIAIMLGMQYSGGEIIKDSLTNQSRTHPTFEPHDPDPSARGFVINSFSEGLTPAQAFFHGMGTRVNIMDTALATGNVGSLSRTLQVALADYYIAYDGSVINSEGQILEFIYGEEGMDPGKLEEIKVENEKIPFFIDIKRIIERLNDKHGYYEMEPLSYAVPEDILSILTGPTEEDVGYTSPSSLYQIRNTLIMESGKELLSELIRAYYDIDEQVLESILATDEVVDTDFYGQLYSEIDMSTAFDKYRDETVEGSQTLYSKVEDNIVIDTDSDDKYVHVGKKYSGNDFATEFLFEAGFDEDNIYYVLDDPKEDKGKGKGKDKDSDNMDRTHRISENGKLPFDDDDVTLMTWIDTLNNVDNIDGTMKEISRVMKDEGHVVVREYEIENDLDRLLSDIEQMLLLNLNQKYNIDSASAYVGSYKGKDEWSKLFDGHGFERINDGIIRTEHGITHIYGVYQYKK